MVTFCNRKHVRHENVLAPLLPLVRHQLALLTASLVQQRDLEAAVALQEAQAQLQAPRLDLELPTTG